MTTDPAGARPEQLLDDLLAANRSYAAGFDAASLPSPPARGLAVLTCMDARVDPQRLLGLDLGDAHVLRNAGGRASDDALRSLVVSAHLLGTRTVLIIHHTDCGMLGMSNAELHDRLTAATGADASGIDFLPFSDLEDSVRDDVQRILDCPLLPADMAVGGFVYDVGSGLLRPISGETGLRRR